jgi:CobQ-like glutamine amidotransferase family enzyme
MNDSKPLSIRIGHLYPSLLSVAGDRGNLFAIQRRCEWRGIGTEVTEIEVGDTPDFTQFDLILFHGGQDKEMDVAARDLGAKAKSLREAVESDVAMLAVCAGYQLLGHYYQPPRGPRLEGIGALDVRTEAGSVRFMNHIAIECEFAGVPGNTLVGFENHSGRTYRGPEVKPLGKVLAGGGNNGEDGTEGAVYREVYCTYMHGPVLPKNPWLTDHLIRRALAHRYGEAPELQPLDAAAEEKAHQSALELAMRNKGKMTAIEATPWKS